MRRFTCLLGRALVAVLLMGVVNVDAGNAQNSAFDVRAALGSDKTWWPNVAADSLGGGTGILTYTFQPVTVPGLHQIYTIRLDGTENEKTIDAAIGLNHQEWSPDGSRFACVGYVDDWTWSIHTFDADGTNLTRLTTVFGVWDNEPAWSPDGEKIAWGRIYPAQNYRAEVWMMNANGTDQHPVGVAGDGVTWSPDGTRLAYHSAISDADIWTCDADGTNPWPLVLLPSDDMMPHWSPDGSKIVFTSNRDGNYEIYVMDADGSNQRRLTNNAVADDGPRWSPDGSLIAFSSGPHFGWEVYVMDSTGANPRRVTYSPAGITGINPDWQPADSTSVPVYLTGLSCAQKGASVKLVWEVRDAALPSDFRLMVDHGDEQRIVPVRATGDKKFEAVDVHPSLREGGTFFFHLFARGDDGGWDLLRVEAVRIEPPNAAAKLLEIYPNPFNPQTTISFSVNYPQRVRIDIHDATGMKVKTLSERVYPAGDYHIFWDGRNKAGGEVSSGIYFLRFQAGKSIESRKLVLIR